MVKKGIYFIILIFFYTLSLNAIQIKVDLLNEANSIIIQNKITASQFYNNHNKYNNVSLIHNKKIKEKSVLKIKRTIDIKNNIPKNEFYEHFVKKTQNTILSNKKNKIQISSGKFHSNKSYNKNNYINNSYMLKNSISNLIIFRNSNFRFYTNNTNVMDSYNIIGLFYFVSGNNNFIFERYYKLYNFNRIYNVDNKENENNDIRQYITDNSRCNCNGFLKNFHNSITFYYPIKRNSDMAKVNIHLFPQNYSFNKLSCFIKRNSKNLFSVGRYTQKIG